MLLRLWYACVGAFVGAALGAVAGWLYGLAHSIRYDGPGLDPNLRLWVLWTALACAVIGFVFRDGVTRLVSWAVEEIFSFEAFHLFDVRVTVRQLVLLAAIVLGVLWYVTS